MCASPEYTPLDEVDRAILQLLQRDARNLTAVDIAEHTGVSDGTVRNRIEKLEKRGVIEGYAPMIDYEMAGYQLERRIECTAPIVERESLTKEALQIEGVVEAHEIMTGRRNVEITAVAPRHDDLTRIAMSLHEMGLAVESEELIRNHYWRPFNHFGTANVSEAVVEDGDSVHDL
jgi:DNA-binding Lrp family transcriptional regulator